jgi:hypothetical protein
MSETTRAVLLGVFTLASGVWVGGYVAIAAVASAATATPSLALIALGALLAN